MSESDRRDRVLGAALAALALLAAIATGARHALRAITDNAGRPATVISAGALLTLALALLTARLVTTRRTLADRRSVLVVPADSFDPSEASVLAFGSALARSRRSVRDLLDWRAGAIRVALDTDGSGCLRYVIEVPRRALPSVRVAVASFGPGVELLEAPQPSEATAGCPPRHVARAELVLARASSEPLRRAGLDPDPLAGFASAMAGLDAGRGDEARVCIDLLPVPAGKRRRFRRRLLREARLGSDLGGGELDRLLSEAGAGRSGREDASDLVARRLGRHALDRKLGADEPLFEIQILARAGSPVEGRAKARITSLLAAFDIFAGENHLRVSGLSLLGAAFLGSDLPGRRGRFDRRLRTGLFRPARRRVVTAGEIAGLLKPPSIRCGPDNVLRSGAMVGPPPRDLRTFRGEGDLIPIGKVEGEEGERTVGVTHRDTYFSYRAGKSRFGKTEPALCEFVHVARSGHGCLLLDPHHDGIERAKPYLTEPGVRERVVELDLTDLSRQPAWNLLAAGGSSPARAAGLVDAVVDAFASALRWDEVNTRALTLTGQSVQALVDLSRAVPPDLAPTIFEIPTLLSDEGFRSAVLPHVSAPVRHYFTERFPRLSPEAITPVTNLLDRLRLSPAAAALLGNPRRSYDAREAMDAGAVVLICPGWGSTRDRLIANLALFDALHALLSRGEISDAGARLLFWMWFDEVQIYDGASNGTFAAMPEQIGKYGGRATYINQNPERLSAGTRDSIFTNRSHVATTALDKKGSAIMAGELGHGIGDEGIASLPKFNSLASVTVDGRISAPFRLRGLSLEELFPGAARPEDVPLLDEAIARNSGSVPVPETLSRLDVHAEEILAHLAGSAARRRPAASARGRELGGGQ